MELLFGELRNYYILLVELCSANR